MQDTKWIERIIGQVTCCRCRRTLKDAEVHGIGVARGSACKQAYEEPQVLVIAECLNCGWRQTLLGELPKDPQLQSYLKTFITRAWQRHFFSKPPKRKKTSGNALDVFVPARLPVEYVPDDQSDAQAPTNIVRPSISPGTPQRLIDDDEQKRFLDRLHRTSLKRKTKSFQNWLRRLTG